MKIAATTTAGATASAENATVMSSRPAKRVSPVTGRVRT